MEEKVWGKACLCKRTVVPLIIFAVRAPLSCLCWEESISRTLFLSSIFLTRRPLWLAGLGPEFNGDDLHSFRFISPYVTGGFNPLPLNPLPSRGLIVVEMTYHLIKMTVHAAGAAVSSGM